MIGVFMSLTNRRFLDIQVSGTNCAVWHFGDGHVNPLAIAGQDDPAKAKFFAKVPNQFSDVSARAFAESFVRAVGNNLDKFRLTKAWQVAWGDPQDKKNYLPLPFYEYEWRRIDVQHVEPGMAYPSINVIVSGITKKIISYDRLYLPVVGEFEPTSPSDQHQKPDSAVIPTTNSP